MNPLLEIRPAACLFVVGPQFSRNCTPDSHKLSYRSVVRTGLTFLQEEGLLTRHGVRELNTLVEKDAVKAMGQLVMHLKSTGLYERWLRKTFHSLQPANISAVPDSVQWLLELQCMGAILACTQYDTLLDKMAGKKPMALVRKDLECLQVEEQQKGESSVLPGSQNSDCNLPGSSGQTRGFLHLHGVHTELDSISLLPYEDMVGANSSEDKNMWSNLQSLFQSKLVFLVGFDDDNDCKDPLLSSLLQLLYPSKDSSACKNPPILLTSTPGADFLKDLSDRILQLRISSIDSLRDLVVPGPLKNFSVGKLKLLL